MTAARIVKAHSVRDLSARPAFNFVDLREEADNVVAQARRVADELLAAAHQEAAALREQTRTAARDEGLRDAYDEIERRAVDQAHAQLNAQLQTALPALKAAAEALQAERDRWLIRWEQTAVRVGVAIAGKLVKSQIATRPELASGMIADALRLAAGQPRVTVHLHPDDLAAWGDQGPKIVESLTACADSTLVADPRISRGGCRIETIHGEIDARVETMLERLTNELIDG
jgi:flagellar biosynthesis/type III secretory pathway protein FliH